MQTGLVVILSAPSGAGKSTICRELLKRNKRLLCSISCTTRPARPGERDGKDYFFLSRAQFRKRVKAGGFLEWAVVHDELYGTPKKFVQERIHEGRSVLLAIDVQGALAIRRRWPDSVLIFILPPSWEALRSRLGRRKDSQASVEKRMLAAREEVRWADRYDYCVVNDRLGEAVDKIVAILTAEGLRTSRMARKKYRPGGSIRGKASLSALQPL